MLSMGCQKNTGYWHCGRRVKKHSDPAGPGFLKKRTRVRNGLTTEHGNLSAILAEHAREIARQVQQVLELQAAEAVVV